MKLRNITKAFTRSIKIADSVIGGYFDTPLDGINPEVRDEQDFLEFLLKQYEGIHSNADNYALHKDVLKTKEDFAAEKEHFVTLVNLAENQCFWYAERRVWPIEKMGTLLDDNVINEIPKGKRQRLLVERLNNYPDEFREVSDKRTPALIRLAKVRVLTPQEVRVYLPKL